MSLESTLPEAGQTVASTRAMTPTPSNPPHLLAGLRAAISFLFPFGRQDDESDAPSYSRAPSWIVPIGLLIGLAWVGVFKATWRYRDELVAIRVMPALAVVLLECLLTGAFLVLGLARTITLLTSVRPLRSETDRIAPLSPLGTLILCLTVLSQWALVANLPATSAWYPSYEDWRYPLRHLYAASVYRPLILAPIWGRWAILLAATVGRTAKQADGQTVTLCQAMRPGRLVLHAVFPFAITSIYLSRERNYVTGMIVGLMVFGFSYVVSVVMARRGGGQTRQSLYAVGEIGQLTFLAMYRAFWPLIHG